jgi:hypothetical protein
MELLEGETLAERLVRGPLPVADALAVAEALAAALAGLAAGGAFTDDVAWWAGLVALLFTWVSGVDYFLSAPRVLRGQQPA